MLWPIRWDTILASVCILADIVETTPIALSVHIESGIVSEEVRLFTGFPLQNNYH